ncbi:MAG TPA: hypothetical protein VJQ47_17670 [Steroidobacteraceae bacterium]|nr:hypothetical protein [Steroidobacteraceae bacterium]
MLPLAHALLLGLALLDATPALGQDGRRLPDLTGIVKDESWAAILGKALFWDTVALRSGGACGGCHSDTAADGDIPAQTDPRAQVLRIADQAFDGVVGSIDGQGPAPDEAVPSNGDQGTGADEPAPLMQRQGPTTDGAVPPSDDQGHSVDAAAARDISVRLARAILQQQPLATKTINPYDELLGSAGPHGNLVSPDGKGLKRTYAWLIQQAFEENLWKASADSASTAGAATGGGRLERNFMLFWALAMRVYEQTWSADIARKHACVTAAPANSSGCPSTLTMPAPIGRATAQPSKKSS